MCVGVTLGSQFGEEYVCATRVLITRYPKEFVRLYLLTHIEIVAITRNLFATMDTIKTLQMIHAFPAQDYAILALQLHHVPYVRPTLQFQ